MKKILLFVFLLSFLVPVFAFASFDVSLKYGSRGDAVIELQDFLQDQGVYSGKVDGRFGLGTRKAVVAFQLVNGLKGDGYFGLGSRTKANSILSTELKPSTDAEQAETGTVSNTTSTVSGCTSTSAYSVITGKPCNGTAPTVSNTNTQQQISQIQSSLNQIVQNTAPQTPIIPKPTVVSFTSSKSTGEVDDSIVVSYKVANATVCTTSKEGVNIQIPFVGTLPEAQETWTLSSDNLRNGAFSYQLICADKDWNTVKQILNISLAAPREVAFTTLAYPRMAVVNQNNAVLEVNNIHNKDVVTLTFIGDVISKTFTENVEGQGRHGATYGVFSHEFDDLTTGTDYTYILKIQRANLFATQTGTFKTLSN